jgi:ribosomal protein L40E
MSVKKVLEKDRLVDCPKCGAQNPDKAAFCSLCLHDFSSPEPSLPAAPPPPPEGRTTLDVANVEVPAKPGTVFDPEIPEARQPE